MITDMHVFARGDRLLLDVPLSLAAPLADKLDALIFSEDAKVTDESAHLFVWTVIKDDGFTHVVGATLPDEFASLTEITADTFEVIRIERGVPRFLADMTEDTIPLEAGIETRAISTSKGCYVGQEVIIRVLHRGHGRVARRLVGLQAGAAGIESGARIKASRDEGAKEIGFVTSAGDSPSRGRVALAYVHRDFVAPGTVVAVNTSDGLSAATVTALPMSASPPASSEG
jgi:folate-binding protein YgfZ